MPFQANVIRVLIASPGDVEDERKIIPEVLADWNAMHAVNNNIILMPVKWETSSAPLLGARPQAIINVQIVKDCDILVGVFWTRLGTHTGVSVSGTAEEIEQFVDMQRPVMLYFSQSVVNPDVIDLDQFTALRKFKEKMRLQGLTESYSGLPDFREKFQRQLSINLTSVLKNILTTEGLACGTAVTKGKPKSTAKQEEASSNTLPIVAETKKSMTDTEIVETLKSAIVAIADESGWANIAPLGKYLKTYTPVNYSTLGFDKLSNLFKKYNNFFEIRHEQKSTNATGLDSMHIRAKKS